MIRVRETLHDEVGDLAAPPGSRDWAVAVRLQLQASLNAFPGSTQHLSNLRDLMREHKGYRHLTDHRDRPFATYAAFCKEPQPYGLGYDPEVIDRLANEGARRTPEERTENPPTLFDVGHNQHSESGCNDITPSIQRGTDADYLVARLKRDFPAIFARMEAGEFRSVRAAALEAGIIKPEFRCACKPTLVARMIRQRFTPEQVAEVVRLLTDPTEAV
jgi:hypothetical protein